MALAAGIILGVVVGAAVLAASSLPLHANGAAPGEFLFEFGGHASHLGYDGEFDGLDEVAVGPMGEIAASDFTHVQLFHPNGTFDVRFNVTHNIHEMVIGPDGRVVIDGGSGFGVYAYYPNGTLDFNVPVDYLVDVDVGPDGAIAALVSSDQRGVWVQIYHPNGTLDFQFGGQGESSLGDLTAANCVAFAPRGVIAVCDSNEDRIQGFHLNGTLAFILPLDHVSEFVYGPTGEMVVKDTRNIYYPDGTFAATLHRSDGFGVYRGHDADIGPLGKIVYADASRQRVVVFNGIESTDDLRPPAGAPPLVAALPTPAEPPLAMSLAGAALAFEFGSLGSGAGQFMAARDIAFGPGGIMAVSDAGSHRVQVFHPNGTFAFALGELGEGPGEFYYPEGLAFGPGGLLAVSDMGNTRVQVFRIQ